MNESKWIYVIFYLLCITYSIGNTQFQFSNKTENTPRIHRRRHNSSLERFPSNLEYRLMQMEVQFIEKFDRINSEIRENNNRLQNLEWQYAETQRSMDGVLPLLEAFLRQQPHQQQIGTWTTSGSPSPSVAGTIDDRLNKLAEAMANLIVASRVFYRDLAEIKGNVSSIGVMTKNIYDGSHQFVTSSTMNKALMSLQSSSPAFVTSKLIHNGSRSYHANCLKILNGNSNSMSGIYQILSNPSSAVPIMVYCDMNTSDGGWTVIQRRYDGSQDFYLPWLDYKHGFGNIGGEFWLGLDNIHDLTGADVNELLVELEDQDGVRVLARYGAFSIGSEVERYRLRVLADYQDSGYSSDIYDERSGDSGSFRPQSSNNNSEDDSIAAGDSLSYHAGSRFSTFDVDQDNWLEGNCAQSHGGGWWYNQCDRSNLNGRYLQPIDQVGDALLPEQLTYQGMYWHTFHGPRYSLRKTRMLIRPTSQTPGDSNKVNVEYDLDKADAEAIENIFGT